jgi:uncharacterized membrane protein YebE (DUF533 family)
VIEIIGLVLGLGLVAGLALWNFSKGEKAGKNAAELKDAKAAVESVIEDKVRASDTPVAGAAERLRKSKWNRDRQLLPESEPDNYK